MRDRVASRSRRYSVSTITGATDYSTPTSDNDDDSDDDILSSLGGYSEDTHAQKAGAIFAKKELGDGGLRFIANVRETQMYSQHTFVQAIRRRALKAAQRNENWLAGEAGGEGNLPMSVGPSPEASPEPVMKSPPEHGGHSQPQKADKAEAPLQVEIPTAEVGPTADPLVSLFTIMLTGSLPTSQKALDDLAATHERGALAAGEAGARAPSQVDGLKTPGKRDAPAAMWRAGIDDANGGAKGDGGGDVLWCNGRCDGTADGPLCSAICVQIWEQRVHDVRRRIAIKQAITRQHHDDLVMNDVTLPTGQRISIRPRANLQKHRNETESQYQKRVAEVLGVTDAVDSASSAGNVNLSAFGTTVGTAVSAHDASHVFGRPSRRRLPRVDEHESNDAHPAGDLNRTEWSSSTAVHVDHLQQFAAQARRKERAGRETPTALRPARQSRDGEVYPEFPSKTASPQGDVYMTDVADRDVLRASAMKSLTGRRAIADDLPGITSRQDRMTLRLYVSDLASPATKAIAAHYMTKERRLREDREARALATLTPFVLSCVLWLKERARYFAAMGIQARVRGWFVRRDLDVLASHLLFRKTQRMLACLVIRNWARVRADGVAARRQRAQMDRLRRRMNPSMMPSIPEEPEWVASAERRSPGRRVVQTPISTSSPLNPVLRPLAGRPGTSLSPPPAPQLLPPWQAFLDRSTGHTYYHNNRSKTSQWQFPGYASPGDPDSSTHADERHHAFAAAAPGVGVGTSPIPATGTPVKKNIGEQIGAIFGGLLRRTGSTSSPMRTSFPPPAQGAGPGPGAATPVLPAEQSASPVGAGANSPTTPASAGADTAPLPASIHDITAGNTSAAPGADLARPASVPSSPLKRALSADSPRSAVELPSQRPKSLDLRRSPSWTLNNNGSSVQGLYRRAGGSKGRLSLALARGMLDGPARKPGERPLSLRLADHPHLLPGHGPGQSQRPISISSNRSSNRESRDSGTLDGAASGPGGGKGKRLPPFLKGTFKPIFDDMLRMMTEVEGHDDDSSQRTSAGYGTVMSTPQFAGPALARAGVAPRPASFDPRDHQPSLAVDPQATGAPGAGPEPQLSLSLSPSNSAGSGAGTSVTRPRVSWDKRKSGDLRPDGALSRDSASPIRGDAEEGSDTRSPDVPSPEPVRRVSELRARFEGRPSLSPLTSASASESQKTVTPPSNVLPQRLQQQASSSPLQTQPAAVPTPQQSQPQPQLQPQEQPQEHQQQLGSTPSAPTFSAPVLTPPVGDGAASTADKAQSRSPSRRTSFREYLSDENRPSLAELAERVAARQSAAAVAVPGPSAAAAAVPPPVAAAAAASAVASASAAVPNAVPKAAATVPAVAIAVTPRPIGPPLPTVPEGPSEATPSEGSATARLTRSESMASEFETPGYYARLLGTEEIQWELDADDPEPVSGKAQGPAAAAGAAVSHGHGHGHGQGHGGEMNARGLPGPRPRPASLQPPVLSADAPPDARGGPTAAAGPADARPSSLAAAAATTAQHGARATPVHSDARGGQLERGRPEKPAHTVLRSLGPLAAENITTPQMTLLVALREALLPGIEVIKHGRSGRPNQRMLFCDSDFTLLYWRAAGEHAAHPAHAPRPRRSSMMANLFGVKSDDDRQVLLRDIEEVSDDMSTEVMRRSLEKHFVAGSNNSQVLSILLAEGRSLDLEVSMDHWPVVYHGLQVLVNYYRRILPSY